MNIETKWLEDFLSLAATQNFSKAAEERHVTQPAFSRRIRALETAIGCHLVDRNHTPVQLTAEGQLFKISASNTLDQLNASIDHIQALSARHQVVDFAVSHTLSLSFFPSFIQSLQSELSNTHTRQLVANVDDSFQALKNGICDFLIAYGGQHSESQNFIGFALATESLIPVSIPNDEGKPLFSLETPPNQGNETTLPYLAYPEDIFLGRQVKRLLSQHATPLKKTVESSMADSLKMMAMQGLGIAWVPAYSVERELEQGNLMICGGDAWHIPLDIWLYRCNRDLSPNTEKLWQSLQARFETKAADQQKQSANAHD
ncbi:LysR substrate-binding domain-containing protein [Litoribacillus peritrichatus]|uniref:LysR substrate-binding domain-containing protein n=1 Tax=Litoribacillus peritrichatus TaxID=718191 RepID=A0ABP7MKD4_9GAMM